MSSAMRAQPPTGLGDDDGGRQPLSALTARLPIVLALITVILIIWPLNGATRDYDEGVYWQSLRAMASGHPLFTSVFSSQPPLFLVSIYPFYMLFGQSIAAARFGIAIFGVIGVLAMYWLGRLLGGPWVGLAAAGLMLVDPVYLHEARTLQAEMPALAMEILCVAFAVAASQRVGRARAVLAVASGLALGAGMMMKLLDVVALIPIALYLARPYFALFDLTGVGLPRRPRGAVAASAVRESLIQWALCAAGAIVAIVVVLLPFAGAFGALWDQVVTFHLAAAKAAPTGYLHNAETIVSGMRLLGVPALLTLLLAWRQRAWSIMPLLLWLIVSGLFLERQMPLFGHHIVLITPCLALLAALGLSLAWQGARDAMRRMPSWAPVAFSGVLAVFFVVGLGVGVASAVANARGLDDNTIRLVGAIEAFTTPGQPIVTDDQFSAALANRDTPPSLVDTSSVRIQTGYLTAAQLEQALSQPNTRFAVLATGRLQTVPGFMPWLTTHYRVVLALGNGETIYERAPASSPIA